jgi:hypothetical protein
VEFIYNPNEDAVNEYMLDSFFKDLHYYYLNEKEKEKEKDIDKDKDIVKEKSNPFYLEIDPNEKLSNLEKNFISRIFMDKEILTNININTNKNININNHNFYIDKKINKKFDHFFSSKKLKEKYNEKINNDYDKIEDKENENENDNNDNDNDNENKDNDINKINDGDY